jgi:proteasome lid subunit RPN8/RPN11
MKIEITNKAFLKLRYFITECPTEISGFGKVREIEREVTQETEEEIEDPKWWNKSKWKFNKSAGTISGPEKILEIYDIEILPQVVSGVHATMSDETLQKFLFDKMKRGQSTKDYKVWWHSHCDMDAYFSVVDTTTIERSTEFPYLISIVGNHAGKMVCRLDVHKPMPMQMDFELVVQKPVDEEIRKWVAKQIKQKVKVMEDFPVQQDYLGSQGYTEYDPVWDAPLNPLNPNNKGFVFHPKKKGQLYNEILEENGYQPEPQYYNDKLVEKGSIVDDDDWPIGGWK